MDDFEDKVTHKLSSVVQMIMGGGKTSVVAPLLSLFLANGDRLVTLLCPDQLLPQSMAEIGEKYSQIIKREVHAFKFMRQETSPENYEAIMDGYRKQRRQLQEARKKRAIMCTTPSSMKSMMLEYIDVLQKVEAFLQQRKVLRLPDEKTHGETCHFEPLNERHEVLTEDDADSSGLYLPKAVISDSLGKMASEHRLQVAVNQARSDMSSALKWNTNHKVR